ncbi:MAG: hypothetical protein HOY71_34945, partial [Nonomuraea sp.]|nr:hypothetical protein [Nonomuraea sp.]
ALAERAGGLDFDRAGGTVGYDGPRGPVYLRGRHLRQRVHLARADGLEFEVVAAL